MLSPKYFGRLWGFKFERRSCSQFSSASFSTVTWTTPKNNVWAFLDAVGAALGGIRLYSETRLQPPKIQIPSGLGRCWANVPDPFFLSLSWVAANIKASPSSATAAPPYPSAEDHFSWSYCCEQLIKPERNIQRAKVEFWFVASGSWEGKC